MEKVYKQAAERIFDEITNEKYKAKVEENLLDPAVKYIGDRLYPYVISASIFFIFFIIILVYVAYILFKINNLHHLQ